MNKLFNSFSLENNDLGDVEIVNEPILDNLDCETATNSMQKYYELENIFENDPYDSTSGEEETVQLASNIFNESDEETDTVDEDLNIDESLMSQDNNSEKNLDSSIYNDHTTDDGLLIENEDCISSEHETTDTVSQTNESDEDSSSHTITRKNLNRSAVQILKNWLIKHRYNPYPTDAEKADLAKETSLSLIQICNWFINARRRFLKQYFQSEGISIDEDKSIHLIRKKPNSTSTETGQLYSAKKLKNIGYTNHSIIDNKNSVNITNSKNKVFGNSFCNINKNVTVDKKKNNSNKLVERDEQEKSNKLKSPNSTADKNIESRMRVKSFMKDTSLNTSSQPTKKIKLDTFSQPTKKIKLDTSINDTMTTPKYQKQSHSPIKTKTDNLPECRYKLDNFISSDMKNKITEKLLKSKQAIEIESCSPERDVNYTNNATTTLEKNDIKAKNEMKIIKETIYKTKPDGIREVVGHKLIDQATKNVLKLELYSKSTLTSSNMQGNESSKLSSNKSVDKEYKINSAQANKVCNNNTSLSSNDENESSKLSSNKTIDKESKIKSTQANKVRQIGPCNKSPTALFPPKNSLSFSPKSVEEEDPLQIKSEDLEKFQILLQAQKAKEQVKNILKKNKQPVVVIEKNESLFRRNVQKTSPQNTISKNSLSVKPKINTNTNNSSTYGYLKANNSGIIIVKRKSDMVDKSSKNNESIKSLSKEANLEKEMHNKKPVISNNNLRNNIITEKIKTKKENTVNAAENQTEIQQNQIKSKRILNRIEKAISNETNTETKQKNVGQQSKPQCMIIENFKRKIIQSSPKMSPYLFNNVRKFICSKEKHTKCLYILIDQDCNSSVTGCSDCDDLMEMEVLESDFEN